MGPVLTDVEQELLATSLTAIARAQYARPGGFASARSGHPEEFLALGLNSADLVMGSLFGAHVEVRADVAASGPYFTVSVTIARDGETWRIVRQFGAETQLETGWTVVTPNPTVLMLPSDLAARLARVVD